MWKAQSEWYTHLNFTKLKITAAYCAISFGLIGSNPS